MFQLYLDMDGVLADFDRHYSETFGVKWAKRATVDANGHDIDWSLIKEHKHFFAGIPPMADMEELILGVRPHVFKVITGVNYSIKEAIQDKLDWMDKYVQPLCEWDIELITTASHTKCKYCEPGDVIIDDWEKYKPLWIAKGGVWITHTSAKTSLEALREAELAHWSVE